MGKTFYSRRILEDMYRHKIIGNGKAGPALLLAIEKNPDKWRLGLVAYTRCLPASKTKDILVEACLGYWTVRAKWVFRQGV